MIPAIFLEIKYDGNKRYNLDRPFVRDSWLYATNGQILVRRLLGGIEAEILDDWRDPSRRLVNPDVVLRGLSFAGAVAIELPNVPEKFTCKACEGSGEVDWIEHEYLEVRQKLTRKGQPVFIDCKNCDGTGTEYNTEPVKVCGKPALYLQGRHIGLLRRHGVKAVQISANTYEPAGSDSESGVVGFEGNGFTGVLMPMDTMRAEDYLRKAAS